MKKRFLLIAVFAVVLSLSLTSCKKEEPKQTEKTVKSPAKVSGLNGDPSSLTVETLPGISASNFPFNKDGVIYALVKYAVLKNGRYYSRCQIKKYDKGVATTLFDDADYPTYNGIAVDSAGNVFFAGRFYSHYGSSLRMDPAGNISTGGGGTYLTDLEIDKEGVMYGVSGIASSLGWVGRDGRWIHVGRHGRLAM